MSYDPIFQINVYHLSENNAFVVSGWQKADLFWITDYYVSDCLQNDALS